MPLKDTLSKGRVGTPWKGEAMRTITRGLHLAIARWTGPREVKRGKSAECVKLKLQMLQHRSAFERR